MSETTNETRSRKFDWLKLGFITYLQVAIHKLGALLVLTITALYPYFPEGFKSSTFRWFIAIAALVAFVLNIWTLAWSKSSDKTAIELQNTNYEDSWRFRGTVLFTAFMLVIVPLVLALLANCLNSKILDGPIFTLSSAWQILGLFAVMALLLFSSFFDEAVYLLAKRERNKNPKRNTAEGSEPQS